MITRIYTLNDENGKIRYVGKTVQKLSEEAKQKIRESNLRRWADRRVA